MKRNYRISVIAALAALALLFCSGMSAYAFAGLDGTFEDFSNMLGNQFSVDVDTKLHSNNDFERTVSFTTNIGQEKSEAYFGDLNTQLTKQSFPADVYYYNINTTDSGTNYTYTLLHGTEQELTAFTQILMPGSTFSLEVDEQNVGAFRDSYVISESLDFSAHCNGLDAGCASYVTYEGFTSVVSAGGGNVEGNTLTVEDRSHSKDPEPISVSFGKDITYTVSQISVATDVNAANIISVAVILEFENEDAGFAVGESACAHFTDFIGKHSDSTYSNPKLHIEKHEGSSSAAVEDGQTSEMVTDYRLVLRAEGKLDDINAVLAAVFGEGNSIELSKGSVNMNGGFFSGIFFNRNSITHNVDLSRLLSDTGCKNTTIPYAFSGSSGSMLLSMNINTSSVDVNENENSAYTTSNGAAFRTLVDYRVLDVGALIIFILVCAAVLCLVAFIVKLLRKRSGKKRIVKSEDIRSEAVKSVALALLPEDERQKSTMTAVPSELLNRPTIVIKPKSDDGLDDDDDDPEGVILFSMILRILLMVQLVLFFFPYFNVSKGNMFDSVDTISGLDLFLGFKIGDVAIAPDRFSIVLFALPMVMLLCLLARKMLPKLALPVAISASSVFSIFYLLNLQNSIYDTLSKAIEAAASSGSFVSQPAAQSGYSFTLVIYIMLAIGGIVLLFSNIMANIALRRQKREEESRRFEV